MTSSAQVVAHIKVGALRELLSQTLFAAAVEETRDWLNGVHLYCEDGQKVSAAACNGPMIALACCIAGKQANFELSLRTVLVREVLEKLKTLQPNLDVELGVRGTDVTVRVQNWAVYAKQIDIAERHVQTLATLVPKTNTVAATVNRSEFIAALSKLKGDALIEFDMDGLVLEGTVVPADISGVIPDQPILFNRLFFAELLSHFTIPLVTLEFQTNSDPVVVRTKQLTAALSPLWWNKT